MESKEFIRGILKPLILSLLSNNKKMYGYEITQRVEELSKGDIRLTYGALYPILYKLEAEGSVVTTTEIVDNRVRKYYALTPAGKKVAKAKVKTTPQQSAVVKRPSPSQKKPQQPRVAQQSPARTLTQNTNHDGLFDE